MSIAEALLEDVQGTAPEKRALFENKAREGDLARSSTRLYSGTHLL